MVVQGDFEVKLVVAPDDDGELPSETGFPEHVKGDQTFVEVEPDAEYLVAVRRVGTQLRKSLIYTIEVDGKCLGWERLTLCTDGRPRGLGKWKYFGHFERDEAGNKGNRVLRFVTPRLTFPKKIGNIDGLVDREGNSMMMGEVEVKIFDAVDSEKLVPSTGGSSVIGDIGQPLDTPSWAAGTPVEIVADLDNNITTQKDLVKAKCVRSSLGVTFFPDRQAIPIRSAYNGLPSSINGVLPKDQLRRNRASYRKGPKVATIVLKYTTTPGLIKAGVLSSPESEANDKKQSSTGYSAGWERRSFKLDKKKRRTSLIGGMSSKRIKKRPDPPGMKYPEEGTTYKRQSETIPTRGNGKDEVGCAAMPIEL